MTSITQNQINCLQKEINDLRIRDAREEKNEIDLNSKISRAKEAASKTNGTSTRQSKLKEAKRLQTNLNKVQNKRANISKNISRKEIQLVSKQNRQLKEIQQETNRHSVLEKQLKRKQEQEEQKTARKVQPHAKIQSIVTETSQPVSKQDYSYDFFISHASEDKDDFVRGLANALEDKGAKVWFDESALQVGDSLSQEIDKGLRESRFGIVVLSKNFLAKKWPRRELDGLTSLEVDGRNLILPIWHKISKDQVMEYSPILADKVALDTSIQSIEKIASELARLIGEED